jgi:heme-degrading monooxygenase HmoA
LGVIKYDEEDKVFARVLTIEGKPEKIDDGIRYFWGEVIPSAQKLSGYEDGYLMVDRKSGKMISVVMWDSLKDIEATSDTANQKLAERVKIAGANKKPKYEIYEIVADKRMII